MAWRRHSTVVIEKTLARHLTAARNGALLSQSELAKAVGRHQTFVAKIEMNRRHVQLTELVQLCAVMGRDPCELFMSVVQSEPIQEVLTLMEDLKSRRALRRSARPGNAS
ncbi:MAG: helix-turn-helix transcriptional regulator [Steroidobacteraceae bacterium]